MQTKLSDLQRLFNAQSSSEVGGYLDKTKGASRGMGSFHVLEKKTIIGIVAIIGIIGVIAAFLLIPGVKNVVWGQTPEEVIVQFLHHIDNGEYSQAAELVCDQVIVGGSGYRSLDKYSKDFLIQQWELGYGTNGKNIKIDNIKVNAINQESEKLYSIQASASVTKGRLILISGIKSEVKTLIENEKFYITKIDGKWMIVSPHDPFSA